MQALRVLLSVHTCVEIMHNDMIMRAYAREVVNKHRMFKMDYALYEAFFPVFAAYMVKQTGHAFSDEQKHAWEHMAERFCHHVRDYLTEQGKA